MSACSKHHKELDATGIGKCSVPMWMNGVPAGFCDKPAYGKPAKCERVRDYNGTLVRIDGKYSGHVPYLACPGHGGPKDNQMKWWLLSGYDIDKIREALLIAGMDDALHTLESGMHKTDVIPDDFKTKEE